MLRLGALVLGVAIAVAAVASSASAALFFLLKPTTAKPGDLVTVRLGGTPPGFTTSQRKKPFKPPIRLYLVAGDEADEIRSRLDRRLSFIGRIVADRNSRGLLTFTVPPLDTNDYVLAYWCPGCARYGSDTFGVQTIPRVSRYRHLMGLRVEMPDPTETCPVTIPRSSSTGRFTYGNGLLATTVPRDGVVVASRYEPDGSLFWKPYWLPRGSARFTGVLTVRGERLDAPSPPMRVLAVRWGSSGSWATASTFPGEGCWRVTGRVGDISLSFVVKVVAG